MPTTKFEDLLSKAPHVVKKIFLLLPAEDLFNCFNGVCSTWTGFILDHLSREESVSDGAAVHSWLKASYSEIFLDCSLEMRSLDVHEIQDFWAQDSLVFAALNVRDRFRDDCVNRFLFAFDSSGTLLCQLTLRSPISKLTFTKDAVLVHYSRSISDAYFDYDMDQVDNQTWEMNKVQIPENLHMILHASSIHDSIILIAKEQREDHHLLVYERSAKEVEFTEHALIDFPESASFYELQTVSVGSWVLALITHNFLTVFDVAAGEKLWEKTFPSKIFCSEETMTEAHLAVTLLPRDPATENPLLILLDLKTGDEVYNFEASCDFREMRCLMAQEKLLITFKDSYTTDQTLIVFNIQSKTMKRVEEANAGIASSLKFVYEERLLAFSLSDRALHSRRGILTTLDLGEKQPLQRRREFFPIQLGKSRNALVQLSESVFVCQKVRNGDDRTGLTLVKLHWLRFH